MKQIISGKQAEYIFLAVAFLAGLFLFFCNLGNQYLWQDESQTALISKTILEHGVAYGTDGRNFFSQEFKAEYGENYIWKWHTWLPFYVVAVFFKLFGAGTFTARVGFAIFGMGTVFLAYGFCKTLWKDTQVAATTVVVLLISVPFLVMSRQCRYYSMGAFFSLLSLYAYLCLLEKRKFSGIIFVLSCILLFHTHYIYCATLLASVGLHVLLFRRDRFLTVFLLCVLVVLVNVPWIVWLSSMKYGERYGKGMFSSAKIFKFAGGYFGLLFGQIFSPFFLLLLPVSVLGSWLRRQKVFSGIICRKDFWPNLALLLFFPVATIGALSIASPWFYLRYLMPLIPVFAIIISLLIVAAVRLHFLVSIAVLVIMCFFGLFGDYLYEITHDYDGPVEGIVKYLNDHGSDDDVVLIVYGDMGVKFYTKMRVFGGLTAEDMSVMGAPDWIINRKYVNYRIRPLKDAIDKYPKGNYRRIVIEYPDIPFENRENPEKRLFQTVLNEDKVIIYQKKK